MIERKGHLKMNAQVMLAYTSKLVTRNTCRTITVFKLGQIQSLNPMKNVISLPVQKHIDCSEMEDKSSINGILKIAGILDVGQHGTAEYTNMNLPL